MDIGRSLVRCEDCFQTIPDKRRSAYPGVRKCVSCQEASEKDAMERF
ncbi:MAG: TraR/DksA C4-type zinc finger protein [Nitrospirota bacterium]|nr:TraR/DksA C4-type zinc finger protein [Nitrospirota bacterium]